MTAEKVKPCIYSAIADAGFHANIIRALLEAATATELQEDAEAFMICCKEHIGPLMEDLRAIEEGM